eukprot:TRINITY_DN9239_c0_g1_i1.p1 TRINITY_DN9239_c0_g1~~TRINITY_DN9239_c0_g1_i1.p1  ORF type:complete len:250 (+),score=24.67 TRINITY_DN9239_c0_g1_i1:202-951(+)
MGEVMELREVVNFIQIFKEICFLEGGMNRDVSLNLDQLEECLLQMFDTLSRFDINQQRDFLAAIRRQIYGIPENKAECHDISKLRNHSEFEEVANYLTRIHEVIQMPDDTDPSQSYKEQTMAILLGDFGWGILHCRMSIVNKPKNLFTRFLSKAQNMLNPISVVRKIVKTSLISSLLSKISTGMNYLPSLMQINFTDIRFDTQAYFSIILRKTWSWPILCTAAMVWISRKASSLFVRAACRNFFTLFGF